MGFFETLQSVGNAFSERCDEANKRMLENGWREHGKDFVLRNYDKIQELASNDKIPKTKRYADWLLTRV